MRKIPRDQFRCGGCDELYHELELIFVGNYEESIGTCGGIRCMMNARDLLGTPSYEILKKTPGGKKTTRKSNGKNKKD